MGAPKRKPATLKQKPVEDVSKRKLYIVAGIVVAFVVIVSVLLIVV